MISVLLLLLCTREIIQPLCLCARGRQWVYCAEVPAACHDLMGQPGRVCRNDDGQWVSMATASGGGRRVVQDRDFARDMCVSCDMGLQGRRSERQPEVFWGGGARGNVKSLGQREELDFRFVVSWIFKLKLIRDKNDS